jgi:hypothetical protein
MAADDKTREELVLHGVNRILDAEHVKAGQRSKFCWNGLTNDGTANLKRAGLGYQDGLLLHAFVYRRPVRIVFVKLVDQVVTLVGGHERLFACDRVLARPTADAPWSVAKTDWCAVSSK